MMTRSLTRIDLAKMPNLRLGEKRKLHAALFLPNFQVHQHLKVIPVVTCISSARRPALLRTRCTNRLNPENNTGRTIRNVKRPTTLWRVVLFSASCPALNALLFDLQPSLAPWVGDVLGYLADYSQYSVMHTDLRPRRRRLLFSPNRSLQRNAGWALT